MTDKMKGCVGPDGQRGITAVDALIADGWQMTTSNGPGMWELSRERRGTVHRAILTEHPSADEISIREKQETRVYVR